MSGETNQMPWDEETETLWKNPNISRLDLLAAMEKACRKFAAQETEELKKIGQRIAEERDTLAMEKNNLVELSVAAMLIAEEPRDLWEHSLVSCPTIDAVKNLRNARDECERQFQAKVAEIGVLVGENMRLAAEHKQCHERNMEVLKEQHQLKDKASYLCGCVNAILKLAKEREKLEREYPAGTCNAEDAWEDYEEHEERTWANLEKAVASLLPFYENKETGPKFKENGGSKTQGPDN